MFWYDDESHFSLDTHHLLLFFIYIYVLDGLERVSTKILPIFFIFFNLFKFSPKFLKFHIYWQVPKFFLPV